MEVQGHTYLNEVPGDADAADLLTHTLRICFISSSQRRYLHSQVQTHILPAPSLKDPQDAHRVSFSTLSAGQSPHGQTQVCVPDAE